MKLTPELLTQAPSALNPIKERQLDLRGKSRSMSVFSSTVMYTGYKIPAIENLGVTKVGVIRFSLHIHSNPTGPT